MLCTARCRTISTWLAIGVLAAAMPLTLGSCPVSSDPEDATLVGTWAGDVDYAVSVTVGSVSSGTMTFSRSFTVTFASTYRPDTLDLVLAGDIDAFAIPAAELIEVGDSVDVTASSTNPITDEVTTAAIHAVVTAVTRGATSYSIDLSIDATFSGATTGTVSGTCSQQASMEDDDTLDWTVTTDLVAGDSSLNVQTHAVSTGTLTRQ